MKTQVFTNRDLIFLPARAKFARNRKISTNENDANTHETDSGPPGGQQQPLPGGSHHQAGSNLSWKKKNGGGNGNRRNDGNKPKMGNWFRYLTFMLVQLLYSLNIHVRPTARSYMIITSLCIDRFQV